MDVDRIEAAGTTPLAPEFARIEAVTNVPSLLTEVAHLHRIGVDAAFDFGVEQDPGHSEDQIASIGQGGLGLPERGYYDRTDKDSQAIRDQYVAHVAKMFALLHEPAAQAAADAMTVLALETKLAQISKYPVDLRDTQANYHKMDAGRSGRSDAGGGLAAVFHRHRPSQSGRHRCRSAGVLHGAGRSADIDTDCRLADLLTLAIGQRRSVRAQQCVRY